MDGERKKRKIDNAEAEEDDEEEKMEKFFALIRSTHDVRERMAMSNVDRLKLEEKKQKKKATYDQNKPPVAVWKPTFQPEDFMEDHPHHHHQYLSTVTTITTTPHPSTSTTHEESHLSNSKKQDEAKDQDDDKFGGDHYHDLDLKLSL